MPRSGLVFAGRHAELATLDAALEAVNAGTPRLVCIEGAAGIGKTALLRRFMMGATEHTALAASGDRAESAVAWGTLAQLLAVVPRSAATSADEVRRLLGPEADPLTVASRIVDALHAVDKACGPVVLALDDAHWADMASARALRLAFRQLCCDRVLVLIATRRDGAATAREEWDRLVCDDARAHGFRLDGLSTDEVAELLTVVDRVVSLAAARRLREHTSGHPQHLRELADELDPAALTGYRGTLPAPRSVDELVRARLACCSPVTRGLVRAAAVLTGPVALERAGALAELVDPYEALAQAVDARLLVEVGGTGEIVVDFPGGLIAAAVYDGLGALSRRELHARAARLFVDDDTLRHRVAAARGGVVPAALLTELDAVAEENANAGALARAARLLDDAVALSCDEQQRERRLLDAAELLLRAGDAAGAHARVVEARAAGPRAQLLAGGCALLLGQPDDAQRQLAAVWDGRTSSPDDPLSAQAAAGLALLAATRGHADDAVLWAERAQVGSLKAAAQAFFAGCLGLALAGRSHDALARLAASSEPATPTLLLSSGVLRTWTDDLAGACADLNMALATAPSTDLQLTGHVLSFLAEAEYRRGQWSEAVAHAELAAVTATEAGRVCDAAVAHAIASRVLTARGDLVDAQVHARAATSVAERAGVELLVACAARARAALAHARGHHVAALAELRTAAAACSPAEPAFFPDEPAEADALVSLGRLDEAEASLNAFERPAEALARRSALAGAARVRARLSAARACHAEAQTHVEAGLAQLAGLGMPFEEARLRLHHAQLLLGAGSACAGKDELRRARTAFVLLGAEPDRVTCDTVQSQWQDHVEPPRASDEFGLTPAEVRVAELVATGLTNKDVGARLFLSAKTVECHLSHVYAKLGIQRRAELAARLSATSARRSADSLRSQHTYG